MKIAFFIPNMRIGGTEIVLKSIINAMIDRYPQYNIDLILAREEGAILRDIDNRISIINLDCKHVKYCLYNLVKYFRKEEPDCFISSLDYSNITASLAHQLSRSSSQLILWEHSITSVHSETTISKYRILRYFLIRYFYNRADHIISVSRGVAEDLTDFFHINKKKLRVIYNPVDQNKIIQLSNREIVKPPLDIYKEKYIISVGRLVQAKNYTLLIQAFNILSKHSLIKLVVIGTGPENNRIQQQIRRLQLDERIILTGNMDNPFPLIKNASVVVLSSKWEGFGLVLLEALVLQKQIVSTDCPSGPREILDHGKYGLLVPVNNPEKLAEGISRIIKGKVKFDEELLLQRAKYFNIEKSFNQFMEVIN